MPLDYKDSENQLSFFTLILGNLEDAIRTWAYGLLNQDPPWEEKNIPKGTASKMIMKPSLSIRIKLYIIYPFPNNKY